MNADQERTAAARRVKRVAGYEHGISDRPPLHRDDAEYMKSYRRGVERRTKLSTGQVGADE